MKENENKLVDDKSFFEVLDTIFRNSKKSSMQEREYDRKTVLNYSLYKKNLMNNLNEKFPNVKMDQEQIEYILNKEEGIEYLQNESSRFYKRESYDAQEQAEESLSQNQAVCYKLKDDFSKNLEKAVSIDFNNFKEEDFEYLRQNNFKGGFSNQVYDFAYTNYCSNKEKEQKIKSLNAEVKDLKE